MSKYQYRISGMATNFPAPSIDVAQEHRSYFLSSDVPLASLESAERAASSLDLGRMSRGGAVKALHVTDVSLLAIDGVPIQQWQTQRIVSAIAFTAQAMSVIAVFTAMILILLIDNSNSFVTKNTGDLFMIATGVAAIIVSYLVGREVRDMAKV